MFGAAAAAGAVIGATVEGPVVLGAGLGAVAVVIGGTATVAGGSAAIAELLGVELTE